jgi:hypothetical protein
MRHAINPQLQIGETLVRDIQFDIHSRDDIPQLLRGLQHLYNDTKARDNILEQLGSVIIAETDPETGRPGMSLWSILVLAHLRSFQSAKSLIYSNHVIFIKNIPLKSMVFF